MTLLVIPTVEEYARLSARVKAKAANRLHDLEAYLDTLDPARLAEPATPAPHGTHAAFTRHRYHGEQPCEVCVVGERVYQRERARRRRAKARAA